MKPAPFCTFLFCTVKWLHILWGKNAGHAFGRYRHFSLYGAQIWAVQGPCSCLSCSACRHRLYRARRTRHICRMGVCVHCDAVFRPAVFPLKPVRGAGPCGARAFCISFILRGIAILTPSGREQAFSGPGPYVDKAKKAMGPAAFTAGPIAPVRRKYEEISFLFRALYSGARACPAAPKGRA